MKSLWQELSILEEECRQTIDRVFATAAKNMWQENHLTAEWLKAVWLVLNETALKGYDGERHIQCSIFSQRGQQETMHGDVGVLIEIDDGEEGHLKGAGFLEAKCRAWDGSDFPSLRKSQISRLYRNVPRSLMLLYDRQPQLGASPGPVPIVEHFFLDTIWPFIGVPATSHARVVPLDLMLRGPRTNPSVYRYSQALSFQIVFRYLQMFDLHFHEKTIELTEGYGRKEEAPTFVLSIKITPQPDRDSPPSINDNMFEFMPGAKKR